MSGKHDIVLTWRSLHLADCVVRRALDQRLTGEAECSLLEHDLLAWVTVAPKQRLQMLELADLLGVTRGGLTRIVDRLVRRGWIQRDRPESNRRAVHAVLTPAGQEATVHARAVYLSTLNQTLGAHLCDHELAQLAGITDKLRTALTGATQGCVPTGQPPGRFAQGHDPPES
jgi:DNA-binding MarR family transcriptional regulator